MDAVERYKQAKYQEGYRKERFFKETDRQPMGYGSRWCCSSDHVKQSSWYKRKEGAEFYLDQRTERRGTRSSMNKKLSRRVEKEKRELQTERTQASASGT